MHRKAQGNRHLSARFVLRVLQHFAKQTEAVFETAAIGITALVVDGRQKVPEDRGIVGSIDIGNVIASLARPPNRRAVVGPQGAKVRQIHRAGHERRVGFQCGQDRWPHRRIAVGNPARPDARMGKLHRCQRAVCLDPRDRGGVTSGVVVIPKPLVAQSG